MGVCSLVLDIVPGHHSVNKFRSEVALWLSEHSTSDTLVALNTAGLIPYRTNLPIVDMLGLNDRYIARHGQRDETLLPGHQLGDGEYVLRREPDYILLGVVAPDDAWQQWPPQPPKKPFVGDRQLWTNPQFWCRYALLRVRQGDVVFNIFQRQEGNICTVKSGDR